MGLTIDKEPEGNPDWGHYDSLSELALGRRFGEEILKIENEGLDGQIQRIQNKINEAKLQEAICDSIVNNNNVLNYRVHIDY